MRNNANTWSSEFAKSCVYVALGFGGTLTTLTLGVLYAAEKLSSLQVPNIVWICVLLLCLCVSLSFLAGTVWRYLWAPKPQSNKVGRSRPLAVIAKGAFLGLLVACSVLIIAICLSWVDHDSNQLTNHNRACTDLQNRLGVTNRKMGKTKEELRQKSQLLRAAKTALLEKDARLNNQEEALEALANRPRRLDPAQSNRSRRLDPAQFAAVMWGVRRLQMIGLDSLCDDPDAMAKIARLAICNDTDKVDTITNFVAPILERWEAQGLLSEFPGPDDSYPDLFQWVRAWQDELEPGKDAVARPRKINAIRNQVEKALARYVSRPKKDEPTIITLPGEILISLVQGVLQVVTLGTANLPATTVVGDLLRDILQEGSAEMDRAMVSAYQDALSATHQRATKDLSVR